MKKPQNWEIDAAVDLVESNIKKEKAKPKVTKKREYVSKAKTTLIGATVRKSLKIGYDYHTFEYHEERCIPQGIQIDLAKEKEALWTDCYNEVVTQVEIECNN